MPCQGPPSSLFGSKNPEPLDLFVSNAHFLDNLLEREFSPLILDADEKVLFLLEQLPHVFLERLLDIWCSPEFRGLVRRRGGSLGALELGGGSGGLALDLVSPEQLADVVAALLKLFVKVIDVVV